MAFGHNDHVSPIKTPKQLVTVILLSFIVPVLAIVLLVKFVSSAKSISAGTAAMTPEAISERLKPVSRVELDSGGGGDAPKTLQAGEAVFKLACSACHGAGLAGAPKAGDAAAWAPRLKQGYDVLVSHATNGYKAMPAKGGNAALDPVEVARAVAYMGNLAGAKFKEPDAVAK
jgi:cytochrome c5